MSYIYIERPWSRKIILKICKQRGITPLELAKSGKFLGKNIRRQLFRMLYEQGYRYNDIKILIFKKQGRNDFDTDREREK